MLNLSSWNAPSLLLSLTPQLIRWVMGVQKVDKKLNACTWKCGHIVIHHLKRKELWTGDNNKRQQTRTKTATNKTKWREGFWTIVWVKAISCIYLEWVYNTRRVALPVLESSICPILAWGRELDSYLTQGHLCKVNVNSLKQNLNSAYQFHFLSQ